MTHLVDQLADLTALRDRDALDAALVTTLHELLQVNHLSVHRLIGTNHDERWLSGVVMDGGKLQPMEAQNWVEIDDLPGRTDLPYRQAALQAQAPVQDLAKSAYVFPLATQSGSTGVLEIMSLSALSAESVRLVSAVLRLYQNFQGLLDYGEHDELTELLNRKTFDGAFLKATTAQFEAPQEVPQERRHSPSEGSYWLAMLDIDHFKRVNDNFGHLIGDEVLLLLAGLMRETFRFHDQLYRFGGEEFVVLMHTAHEGHSQAALERLRKRTETHLFPQVGHITVSIGFTQVLRGDTPSAAFERADKAVYYAKEHGRNQVFGYEDLVAQGLLAAEPVNLGDVELF